MAVCSKCGAPLQCPDHGAHKAAGVVASCAPKKGEIWVKVVDDDGKAVEKVEVSVAGATKTTDPKGFISFDPMDDGDYQVQLGGALPDELQKSHVLPPEKSKPAPVKEGEVSLVKFKLAKVNEVKAVIGLEHKVVLLDRKLSDHQAGEDAKDKVFASPTCIQITLKQTNAKAHPFQKGATLKLDPANVEVFRDEKCEQKSDDLKLTNDELTGADPLKLWLRGKQKGKFKVSIVLEDPSDELIKLSEEANEQAMGVVELEMKLHQFAEADLKGILPVDWTAADYVEKLKAQKIPDQKEMKDEEKVKSPGRFLHVQKDGNTGRAKLILKQLVADQWPDGCDDYEIVIDKEFASGSLKLFDAEEKGTEQKMPLAIKKSALSADKTYWVEGETATTKPVHARLDVGIRRKKEDADELEPKHRRNGDWARFTVVKIDKVELVVATEADQAVVWDEAKKRFYVNLDGEKGARELKDHAGKRKVKLVATLSEKIKDVPLHFMLAGDEKNRKKDHWGNGLPASWKWHELDAALMAKDKDDTKDLVHMSVKTDDKGEAVMQKLVLSRFGGDAFSLGAYITQDPHLGKYIHGDADLSKRKPILQSKEINVWRKMSMQLTFNKNATPPGRGTSVTAFEKAFVELGEVDEKQYDGATVAGLVEHPNWQFVPKTGGATKIVCVGDHNKAKFHPFFKAQSETTKPKTHMILCDHQWDPAAGTQKTFAFATRTKAIYYPDASGNGYMGVFDPPLNGGGLVDAANSNWSWNDGTNTHTGSLAAANVKVKQTRDYTCEVEVTIDAKCTAGTCTGCAGGTDISPNAAKKATVKLKLNAASGPWAGESGQPGSPHCLIVIDPSSNTFNNTITHEVGHLFQAVRTTQNWHGLPDHPNQYVKRGGQGSHCKKDASEHATELDQDGAKQYTGGTCIMYHVAVGNTAFCDDCSADLRIRDAHDFFKDGS